MDQDKINDLRQLLAEIDACARWSTKFLDHHFIAGTTRRKRELRRSLISELNEIEQIAVEARQIIEEVDQPWLDDPEVDERPSFDEVFFEKEDETSE